MQLPRRARLVPAVLLGALCGRGAAGGRLVAGGPLEKILTMLKDLKADIIKDGEVEQQTYNKYACWCEKATAKKADAISGAQDDLRALGQSILQSKGEVAVLSAEVKELKEKVEANIAAQEKATAVRQKANAEYMTSTAEMKQAMAALEKAIVVLSKGTAADGAFLQQGVGARAVVKTVIEKIPGLASLKPKQLSQLSTFVSATSGSKYMPQSMTVQGILKDMYETFADDVESTTHAEATQNTQFESLIAEKVEQLNLHNEEIAKKESKKAETEQKLADDSGLYDDTEAQMQADIEFFDETKGACQTKSDDWNARHRARTEELEGVTKAIEMLSSDDARELFARANQPGKETGASDSFDTGVDIAPALLQIKEISGAPERAYTALKARATASKSIRLALLAAHVRQAAAGHFDEIIQKIDEMIATLKQEDLSDIAKRDQCKEEFKKTNSTIADLTWKIEVNSAKIEKLERSIAALEEEKTKTVEEITEVENHMAQMQEEREAEHDEFKQAKKDDQDAIALLMETREVLSSYYANHSISMGPIQGGVKDLALAQGSHRRQGPEFERSEFDAPEIGFSGKSERASQSKGVISMITMVIEDLDDEIKNSMKAEMEAQLEFEGMIKAGEALKENLLKKKVQLEGMIAGDGEKKTEEEGTKESNEALVTSEKEYRKSIEPDCKWIFGAFEERASKRAVEMEGLVTAKDYLAGAKPGQEALLASRNRLMHTTA